ncbi:hypothetical protein [Actinokineospora bangkokensis]|uniref:Uncharacterized protein n=1 Tax=Actinokineospora bangkokensis TaxID=1193682 RepID=A0A1Q9LD62_9PSEU|nr:hypothetical protein BJP25_02915 [Actinokineospora bangkokensis]
MLDELEELVEDVPADEPDVLDDPDVVDSDFDDPEPAESEEPESDLPAGVLLDEDDRLSLR